MPTKMTSVAPSEINGPTAIPTSSSTNKIWHIIPMLTKVASVALSETNDPTALPSCI